MYLPLEMAIMRDRQPIAEKLQVICLYAAPLHFVYEECTQHLPGLIGLPKALEVRLKFSTVWLINVTLCLEK
ncbi:hypothetical protein C2S51_025635 [Perilla frutescens var. frutescens]|nr:hypothetical protein C2S51_025635 [Perilla frutescens var. frutescens]